MSEINDHHEEENVEPDDATNMRRASASGSNDKSEGGDGGDGGGDVTVDVNGDERAEQFFRRGAADANRARLSRHIRQMFKNVVMYQMSALNSLEKFYESQVSKLEMDRQRNLALYADNKEKINRFFDNQLRLLEERVQSNLAHICKQKQQQMAGVVPMPSGTQPTSRVSASGLLQSCVTRENQEAAAATAARALKPRGAGALLDLKNDLNKANLLLPSKSVQPATGQRQDQTIGNLVLSNDTTQVIEVFKRHLSLPFYKCKHGGRNQLQQHKLQPSQDQHQTAAFRSGSVDDKKLRLNTQQAAAQRPLINTNPAVSSAPGGHKSRQYAFVKAMSPANKATNDYSTLLKADRSRQRTSSAASTNASVKSQYQKKNATVANTNANSNGYASANAVIMRKCSSSNENVSLTSGDSVLSLKSGGSNSRCSSRLEATIVAAKPTGTYAQIKRQQQYAIALNTSQQQTATTTTTATTSDSSDPQLQHKPFYKLNATNNMFDFALDDDSAAYVRAQLDCRRNSSISTLNERPCSVYAKRCVNSFVKNSTMNSNSSVAADSASSSPVFDMNCLIKYVPARLSDAHCLFKLSQQQKHILRAVSNENVSIDELAFRTSYSGLIETEV
jgi:hypothetical protein